MKLERQIETQADRRASAFNRRLRSGRWSEPQDRGLPPGLGLILLVCVGLAIAAAALSG